MTHMGTMLDSLKLTLTSSSSQSSTSKPLSFHPRRILPPELFHLCNIFCVTFLATRTTTTCTSPAGASRWFINKTLYPGSGRSFLDGMDFQSLQSLFYLPHPFSPFICASVGHPWRLIIVFNTMTKFLLLTIFCPLTS